MHPHLILIRLWPEPRFLPHRFQAALNQVNYASLALRNADAQPSTADFDDDDDDAVLAASLQRCVVGWCVEPFWARIGVWGHPLARDSINILIFDPTTLTHACAGSGCVR